ncbi:MAG: ThuA domain-containing protein [Acidobacteria bacterium]|nr:ThuA domain-containing protein [Acidobacteriota bacterium]
MARRSLLPLLLLLAVSASAQEAPRKKRILFLGGSEAYAHDAVSHAMYTMAKIGQDSGLFEVRFHTDMELVTKQPLKGNKKNLDWFDAVMFYTQGDLPLTDQQKADLMSFVKEDGKGVLAAHSGTDSFRESWPEYVEMIGGAFNHHPWHEEVRVLVDDRSFPATRHFFPSFRITDEIYQLNRYSRDKVRVLMRLDPHSVDLTKKGVERTDGDFALTWVRNWGKGRVFTSVLGHRPEVWDRYDIQKMWMEAAKWVLGMTEGDVKSLPLASDD